jgi:hypothetical protein
VVNPTVSPVTAEFGSFTDDAEPVPEKVVQVPVSGTLTELAANVPEVTLHRFCVGPASATVIAESTLIVTSEDEGPHAPKPEVMVQRSTVVNPTVSPVTAELGSFTDDAEPDPDMVNHVPVSGTLTEFAANVPEVTLQRSCTGPATEAVIAESTFIVTLEAVATHAPNPEEIVHVSTVVKPTVSPVTAELGSFAEDAEPVPENVVQVPVSETLTELAASVPEVTLQRS